MSENRITCGQPIWGAAGEKQPSRNCGFEVALPGDMSAREFKPEVCALEQGCSIAGKCPLKAAGIFPRPFSTEDLS